MRQFFCILVALLAAAPAGGGVRRWEAARPAVQGPLIASDSAALFVGIREFPYDRTLTEVRYAVDDAIDLAYLMAIDRQPPLVDPKRVVLALSGEPQKERSQASLKLLRAAGAAVKPAREADVLKLLEEQSRAVGRRGMLIVSFATHGVNDEGTQYLLAADSLIRHRGTGISEPKVREIVAEADVPRALILIDACRQRLSADARAGDADPRAAAALMTDLASSNGQVVISAAAPGRYAYDDDARGNGVFTAAVLDGMRCRAAADARGYVTVDTLWTYVEMEVLQWVRRNRDPSARVATHLYCDGASKQMPLAICPSGTERDSRLPSQ